MGVKENLQSETSELGKMLESTVDVGEQISDARRRTAAVVEGIVLPDESDQAALKSVLEGISADAETDFVEKVESRMEEISSRGEGIKADASEALSETQAGASQLEQANSLSEYGNNAFEEAANLLGSSIEAYEQIVGAVSTELQEAKSKTGALKDSLQG